MNTSPVTRASLPFPRLLVPTFLALASLAAFARPAGAQVLLQENFTFTGALTNNGWATAANAGVNPLFATNPGLTYPSLPSSGTGNAVTLTNSGEDDYKILGATNTAGDIYTSFLVNVSQARTGDYFYAFYSTASSGGGYFGRVHVRTNASGVGFNFGIGKATAVSGTSPVYETNVRTLDTTYLVVAKMTRNPASTNDDFVSLWINPALGSAEPAADLTNAVGNDNTNFINAVALRQGGSTAAPTLRAGNILVGTTWASVTPASGAPVIIPSGTLASFSTFAGTASASQSIPVGATNLTAAITATAPAGMEVSADNSTFAPLTTLPATGGTLYARVSAAAPAGVISSTITLSSAGATDQSVAVSASVRPSSISLPYGPDTFTTNSFPWYTFTVDGTKNWTRVTSGGNSFMEINGYDTATNAVPANAWLILGPFNVPAGASNLVAQFNVQRAFTNGSDSEFNFKFSTNYAGTGDPSTAGWSDLAFNKPAAVTNTASTDFSPSGAVALPSALAGKTNLYVAYQLQAASTTNTSRWRVDDFEMFTSSLPVLSLIVNPSSVDEGSGATGTVTLPSVSSTDVNVTVSSADAGLLQIEGGASAVVTIPANTDPPTATFAVTTTRDWVVGPDQQVQITADGGASYEFGQALVTVKNIDVPSVSLTSGGYAQDFATFTSQATLPTGWSLVASVQTYSAWGDTNTTSGAKFSSAPVNVFGYQHTSSTGTAQQILTLRNDTGSTITDLVVSYRGRMARPAETRNPAYSVTVGGFTVPALAYSTAEGDDVLCTANVSGLAVEPGQTVQINWSSDRGLPTGTSRQIGIGNVSVTAGSAALPPAVRSLSVPAGTITQTSAVAEANVVSDQGSEITARGFVYALTSVNPDPAVGGTGVTNLPDAFAEVGPMTATLSGLTPGAQYSIKAYATNANGTTYTAVQTFTTVSAPVAFSGTYAEAFNNFTAATSPALAGGSVKTGWTAVSSGGIQTYSGSWTTSSTTGGFYGGVSNPGALGYQPTTSSGTLTVTCRLVNNTGAPLTQLYVKYLGRTQMTANTRIPTWAVNVAGVAAPSLDYSTANGVDETKSGLITGLNVAAGAEFQITWVSDQGTGTGSFRRIGLADVIVSTSAIPDPAINITGSLAPFNTTLGTASASQSFSASGTGISGDITVTAPANYQVSLDNSAFSSSVLLPSSSGTVASTPVYVRIAATAPVGNPAGLVALTSSGATTQNIAVTGTVSSGANAYDTWASGFGLDPATNGAPTADPDGDTFSNAQEYAFGTDPTAGNPALLSASSAGGNLTVSWLERSDVTYAVQSTANLASTAFADDGTVSVVNGPVDPAPPAGYTRKQFTVPATGNKFYRVKGTQAP